MVNQNKILTGPKLVTPRNAKTMLMQEQWTATTFKEYALNFSVMTGRYDPLPFTKRSRYRLLLWVTEPDGPFHFTIG